MLASQLREPSFVKNDKKIRFNEYDFIADNFPEQVLTQRTVGKVGPTTASFRTQPSMPNMLLLSKVYIKWKYTITKTRNAVVPVGEDFGFKDASVPTEGENIPLKPFMAMANATTSIRLSINGHGITYRDPRYWQKYIGQLFCPNEALEKYYTTAGGLFSLNRGAYNIINGTADIPNGSDGDPNLDLSADLTFEMYAPEAGTDDTATIDFFEPLYVGPFNWAHDIKDKLPQNYWGRKMSNLIPYVRDLHYEVQFDKLAANCFHYLYGVSNAGLFEEVELVSNGLVSAEMVLQWIKPHNLQILHQPTFPNIHNIVSTQQDFESNNPSIPDEVKLQCWNLDHRQFLVNNGAILVSGDTTTVNVPSFNTYSVPTFILMFATRDKDDVNYQAISVLRSDNNGANAAQSAEINSLEANCNLDEINIQINADKDRISVRFDNRELYNITLKNAKKDYPYDLAKYIGGFQRQADYPGQMCVLFTPDDLNISSTTGRLNRDFVFQAEVLCRACGGHHVKDLAGDFVYRLHVIFLYDKYYMKINNKGMVEYRAESEF